MSKRGRPLGHRLSEESKRAIAESKRGQKQKPETRDKISRSLILYFSQFNSLSEEIENRYCRTNDDEVCNWANEVRDELDNSDNVLTSRTMRNRRSIELTSGQNIEFYSHSMTPEFMLLVKEIVETYGTDAAGILEGLL